MSERIRILLLYSNPKDLSRIRLAEEVREIEYAIQLSAFRDRFEELKIIHAPRTGDIRRALLKYRPHILHFSGHGSKTKGIFVEDDNGNARSIRPDALAELLSIIKDNLQIVVFNACYSSTQAAAISRIVDFTIGMQHAVFDQSAIKFSVAFYEGLACGRTVSESFQLAINALSLDEIPDADIPLLLAETGIDPATTRIVFTGPAPAPVPETPKSDGTMHLDLIVLGRGTPKIIKAWQYNTDGAHPFFVPADKKEKQITLRQTWQELYELSKPTRKTAAAGGALDIFLRLRESAIETLINHKHLADMVDEAIYHSAGNNLFIAWNQETFARLYQKPNVLKSWFSRLIRSGVADLIEIPTQRPLNEEGVIKILYERALQSQHRRQTLQKLVSADEWNLVLNRPLSARLLLPKFLDTFQAEEQLTFDEGNNLAVFYEQMPKQGWFKLIEDSRDFKRNGNWFIATLVQSNDLAEFWKQEARESRPNYFDGVIEFNGCFEWCYAFLRLQLAARVAQLTSRNAAYKALF
jgi:CHAT domain